MVCSILSHHHLLSVLTFGQRRDSGWIHTLLEEAENERMHLMSVALPHVFHADMNLCRTFMTLRNPGILLRALILAAQGVFYNVFCMLSSLLV
jgi:ubiquinol oxidase